MGRSLPFDVAVQLFTKELADLCDKYGIVLRGQVPRTTLHAYNARAHPEHIDGATHNPKAYRCIDLCNLHQRSQ